MLSFAQYLDLIAHDTMRVVGAMRRTDPSAPVPGCPDWRAGELLTHLIEMNDIWGWLVSHRPHDFGEGFEGVSVPAAHADRLDLLDVTNHQLVEALRQAGPDEPVCYFGEQAPAVRVARLMALETVMHSRDAEESAGMAVTPIPADAAADGIAQQLAHLDDGDQAAWLPSGVSLTSTDTGDSWTVLVAESDLDGTLRLTDQAPVGAQVSAPASTLLPWLFARTHDPSLVTESGDPSLLRTLRLALGHEVAPLGRRRWWGR
ncbi:MULTISPECIES: maleylpyruvate isomerase N-terminal domain-containing protein [Nocardioides]|uniref:maleylpyruvate isomerase N-terminal domain-containing protein n=1 Tax=Nocardioides TaxID=1839 RepID=UPI00032E6B39|nr:MULTISPECIES: maleylpyruvate isomerase N-terminal domain-containing protein [Nocardioides]EON22214.1 hypothetical protein CF8_3921 [Nocardioides sp. CF8]